MFVLQMLVTFFKFKKTKLKRMTQKLAIREIFRLDFFSTLYFARIHRLSFLSLCKLLNVIKKYKIISLPS